MATEWGSTNLDRLERFWQAVEHSNAPVRVVAFGDSVQRSYRSLGKWVFQSLDNELGQAGIAFAEQSSSLAWPQFGGGTYIHGWDANWWIDYGVVPEGGYLFWTNQAHATGSLPADRIGLYYLTGPDGGNLKLSVSTNGGPWAELENLDTWSAQVEGRCTKLNVAPGLYRLRVDGVTGINRILGPELIDTANRGIVTTYLAKDGANLNQILSVPPAVLYPIMSNLNPHLVIWHMKELADIGGPALSNRMCDLEDLWQACVPNGDVIYIGTPYELRDQATNHTEMQNEIVRDAASRDGRCYLDCMTPMVSYSWMISHGYLDDFVHPSNACYTNLAAILWRQTGFYALRLNREIECQRTESGLRLEWETRANVNFELQQCGGPDFGSWEPLLSVPGTGVSFAVTNDTAGPAQFYRLRLSTE